MNSEKDDTIGKLLDESQDMIKRFEALVDKDKVEELTAEMQKEALEQMESRLEPAADAWFDLFVEDDSMTVLAEFRPPAGGGKPLELDRIEAALAEKAITHGIQWEAIQQALMDCNLGFQYQTGVAIAKGTAPMPFVPAHIKVDDRWLSPPPSETEGDAAVDYKEITPFLMVNPGDLLAVRVPDAFGLPGTDVLGREVAYPTEKPKAWVPGPNVVETPVGFEAGVEGRLVLTPPKFEVSPVLELKEGVDFHTGNIRFKGEVIVHGRVAAGFSIEAGGGLTSTDVLDAFQVKVGGDLVTPAGIIGNGEGRVEVGGVLSAKFLEHLYVLAQGEVKAESVILNSIVKTRGRVLLGDKGILAGGQLHCLGSVDVYQIGTATGPQTELFVGLDYQGMERILWIRERSRELHTQLKKVDLAIPFGGARTGELMAAAKRLRIEIVQLTETARDQLMKLGQNEEASVTVRGVVYPGTKIEICHVQFQVNQKMKGIKFFLDKRKGTIGVAELSAEATTRSGTAPKKR